ncbi:MAG: OadG family protein [Chloroflexi bacterium]|nr:OadG family protein [Chloroflexota bacterium]
MLKALYMALGGMAIVFAALTLVLLVMVALGRVFKAKPETEPKG